MRKYVARKYAYIHSAIALTTCCTYPPCELTHLSLSLENASICVSITDQIAVTKNMNPSRRIERSNANLIIANLNVLKNPIVRNEIHVVVRMNSADEVRRQADDIMYGMSISVVRKSGVIE